MDHIDQSQCLEFPEYDFAKLYVETLREGCSKVLCSSPKVRETAIGVNAGCHGGDDGLGRLALALCYRETIS